MQERNEVHEEGTQPANETTTQQDTVNAELASDVPMMPSTETPISSCPSGQIETDKEQNRYLSSPASKDKPRPDGVKKAKNQRQRRKQQFSDQQNMISDNISAALIGVGARAEERTRRQEELKRKRDEILDQRFEEQKQMTLKEHELTMEYKKTMLLKDLEYINDRLVLAYRELEALNPSSPMTPRERFEYDMKKDWVEMLEAQHEGKKRKPRRATSPIHSPESSTCIPTPSRLDDEGWAHNLGNQ